MVPWVFNTALDNVVSMTAVGKAVNTEFGEVMRLCTQVAGSDPDAGGAHLRFASDAYASCRAGAGLVVRPLEGARSRMLQERSGTELAHKAGGLSSKPFEFAAGSPIELQVAGVGDSRLLGVYPRTAPLWRWSDLDACPVAQRAGRPMCWARSRCRVTGWSNVRGRCSRAET